MTIEIYVSGWLVIYLLVAAGLVYELIRDDHFEIGPECAALYVYAAVTWPLLLLALLVTVAVMVVRDRAWRYWPYWPRRRA